MFRTIGVSLFAIMIASSARAQQVGDVFYIAMENHNWTQPPGATGIPAQIFGNSAAPFINSLVTAGNPNAAQVSYASNYQNVTVGLHPSEPNYVYQVSGVTGPLNDADPYANTPNNIVNAPNLGQLMAAKGLTWRSYQEDTNLLSTTGQNFNNPAATGTLTNNVASKSQYEVPLTSFSGTSSSYTNPYNGSNQYNYAAKHDPFVFFTATNGGNNPTSSNPQAQNYAPLQQLKADLAGNSVANFNWITPDQYNDMHSALNTNFTYKGHTYLAGTDAEQIALGDNFLSIVVPEIEASQAFKKNGMIVIWNDETEQPDGSTSTAGYTGMEIVISSLAKGNAYHNDILYTHASDLVTLQNIFRVEGDGPYLGGAGGANSLSDLFQPGAIPSGVPEPSTWALMLLGFVGLAGAAAYRRKPAAPNTAVAG
jgi:hypothetical protein